MFSKSKCKQSRKHWALDLGLKRNVFCNYLASFDDIDCSYSDSGDQ